MGSYETVFVNIDKRCVMKRDEEDRIKKTLAKNHACYVLITCGEPTLDGNMEVKMSYEGDVALASYLLQGAQNIIDES
jgi:hypothetical protein